jgi:hypothetical protein
MMGDDNRTVHGMWKGTRLSPMELLTIRSFQAHGHEFVLWLYDELETPLPPETVIRDATEIIPRTRVFRYRAGATRGSYAGFSDLFRYRLLWEVGGWWVDMDVVCLKPFAFPEPYVFRGHPSLGMTGNMIKVPARSALMEGCYRRACQEVTDDNCDWTLPIRILADEVRRRGLSGYVQPLPVFGGREGIHWLTDPRCMPDERAYAVHWCHEWTRRHGVDNARPVPNTFYHRCLEHYGLLGA